MVEQAFLTGRLLVAMPGIDDPRFERAVVFVCAHDEEHAMGLALNRPVEGLSLPALLAQLGVDNADQAPGETVRMGGPVQRERGFVLHTDDYHSPGSSLPLGEGLSLTVTREVLEALTRYEERPRRSLLALGYSGWGPGQLEDEVRQSVWLVADPDEALIFGDDFDHKWSAALAKLGITPDHLSAQAGSA